MPSYGWPLSKVLDRIQMTADMTVEDYLGDGEWFRLAAYRLRDNVLFNTLSNQWSSLVFPEDGSFALIHCQAGGQSGVWLHYLATDDQRSEYLCGCYQIASW